MSHFLFVYRPPAGGRLAEGVLAIEDCLERCAPVHLRMWVYLFCGLGKGIEKAPRGSLFKTLMVRLAPLFDNLRYLAVGYGLRVYGFDNQIVSLKI